MDDPTYVPTTLTTVASEQLQEEVKKELEVEDPKDKEALAKIIDKVEE
jgi:hypothetical protein